MRQVTWTPNPGPRRGALKAEDPRVCKGGCMTELHTEIRAPEFTVAIRGYDRAQVDEYIEYLQRLVASAQERARDAATEYVFDQHAAIGPRVAEIFALAEAEARDLREQVTTEATGLVS